MKRSPSAAGVAPTAHAALVEHAEVADERLEGAPVAGRADQSLGLDP
jgi:hypothetical protein